MKKILCLFLAVAMMVLSLAIMSSCGAPKDDGAQIDIYLGNQVFDFDPTEYYVDSNAEQVLALLYEPLFRINNGGGLECAAASGYTVDEKERQIVITLRESYWSDGIKVKASDFVYAWVERILDPNTQNPAAALFYDIENAAAVKSGNGSIYEIGVEATANDEITITYRKGADYKQLLRNLASVATSPVRQDMVYSTPSYWSKLINTMVFNGPFKVQSIDNILGNFTLARNVGYQQNPDTVDYDNIVTPGQLVATFSIGADSVPVSYADIESKATFIMQDAPLADRAANKGSATTTDLTSVYTYVFNTEKAPFDNSDVRRALSLAIDRAAIVKAITYGVAADGFLPNISGGSTEELIGAQDLTEAKALIAGANLTANEKRITLTVNNDEESVKIAELVSLAWGELGFTVTVKAVGSILTTLADSTEIYDSEIQVLAKNAAVGQRDFDVLALDWQLYSEDAFVGLSAFANAFSGNGVDFTALQNRANIAGWNNAEYNALITEAFKSQGEERANILEKAEKLLVESAPVCPIIFNQNFVYVSSEISGITVDGLGHFIYTKIQLKNYESYLDEED